MSFSENLYYLRKREGISQEELAEKLGVSRQAVSKWETGDAFPETEKIIMLCDRYGVTMDALMRGDVNEQPTEKQASEEQSAAASEPVQTEDDEDEKEDTVAQKIAQSVVWLCAVLVYLVLGVFGDLWHPAWILFVFTPAIASVASLIAAPKEQKMRLVAGTINIVVILGSVTIYLVCGFFLGMWGTMWVVFFAIPITFIITDIVFRKYKKD